MMDAENKLSVAIPKCEGLKDVIWWLHENKEELGGLQFDIAHRGTDVSPVAEHFNSRTHLDSDITIMIVELSSSCD